MLGTLPWVWRALGQQPASQGGGAGCWQLPGVLSAARRLDESCNGERALKARLTTTELAARTRAPSFALLASACAAVQIFAQGGQRARGLHLFALLTRRPPRCKSTSYVL